MMKTLTLCFSVVVLCSIFSGCGGSSGPADLPEMIAIESPQGNDSESINLVGVQDWNLIGDRQNSPLEIVSVEPDAIKFTRVVPGIWRAEALSSWRTDVEVRRNGVCVLKKHVVTTHIIPEKLEIMVDGAVMVTETEFDAGNLTIDQSKRIVVSWIDHYALGYPGWVGSPYINALWVVPVGLHMSVNESTAKDISLKGTALGEQLLTGDVAGKKFHIRFNVVN